MIVVPDAFPDDSSGVSVTVLIFDDDPLNRAMLSMSLGNLGHEHARPGACLDKKRMADVLSDWNLRRLVPTFEIASLA